MKPSHHLADVKLSPLHLSRSCKLMHFPWIPWKNPARFLLKMRSFEDPCQQCIHHQVLWKILQGWCFSRRSCKGYISLKDSCREHIHWKHLSRNVLNARILQDTFMESKKLARFAVLLNLGSLHGNAYKWFHT